MPPVLSTYLSQPAFDFRHSWAALFVHVPFFKAATMAALLDIGWSAAIKVRKAQPATVLAGALRER